MISHTLKVKSLSRVQLFATPWTVAHQVPPSMGFSRQEYWSGLPFPSPGESSRPRDRTQVSHIAGRCFNLWAPREAPKIGINYRYWSSNKNSSSKVVEYLAIDINISPYLEINFNLYSLRAIIMSATHKNTNIFKTSSLTAGWLKETRLRVKKKSC